MPVVTRRTRRPPYARLPSRLVAGAPGRIRDAPCPSRGLPVVVVRPYAYRRDWRVRRRHPRPSQIHRGLGGLWRTRRGLRLALERLVQQRLKQVLRLPLGLPLLSAQPLVLLHDGGELLL